MKGIKLILTILSCLVFSVYSIHAADRTPSKGETFPDITLAIPEKASEKDYLGLTGKGTFRISQIKADLVILEIFSMYCPYCQKEAPNVNELYQLIIKKTDCKDRIKIIGIGAGNTPYEVEFFRSKYDIQFPLFTDESFIVHKAVGEVRTPYFFVIKRSADDGSNRLVYSKVGSIQDPETFLEMIIQESGLKK